jgi:hypothetical protein
LDHPHSPLVRTLAPWLLAAAVALTGACDAGRSPAAPKTLGTPSDPNARISPDAPETPTPPSVPLTPSIDGQTLVAVAGDEQDAEGGAALPLPITARLTDVTGRPIAGARVVWSPTEGGDADPAESITDNLGLARTEWTLGAQSGPQAINATTAQTARASFRAAATAPLALGSIRRLPVNTFDGSGQVVHPDVARVPRAWTLGRRYLAITPYPNGDSRLELPSVFVSGGAATWILPPDGTNPIASIGEGYLSDPDVLFEPLRRELWLYYRAVTSENVIYRTTSANGVRWTTPLPVVRAPNHSIISPSVVRVSATEWHMWSVDGGTAGCSGLTTGVDHRTSTDGVRWSAPEAVTFGVSGLFAWHLDVEWIPERKEYWALFNAKTAGTCATPALYLATSPDGVNWTTLPSPILARGAIPEFRDLVYRSTLEYDGETDVVTLWYSGATWNGFKWVWSAAVQRLRRPDLFAAGRRSAMVVGQPSRNVPPLLQAP